MKQQAPRKEKPLFFSLRIYCREATLVDVRDQALTPKAWYDTMDVMEHKGALPKESPRRNVLKMLERGL